MDLHGIMGQFSFGKANSYPVLQPIWDIGCFRVIFLRLSQHGAEGISTGHVEVSVTQTTKQTCPLHSILIYLL